MMNMILNINILSFIIFLSTQVERSFLSLVGFPDKITTIMCTHTRNITVNGRTMRVPCGHCIPCLQEKAIKNANKIRASVGPGTTALMVHLTYHNDCIPYIQYDDLTLFSPDWKHGEDDFSVGSEISIYRGSDSRRIHSSFGSKHTFLRRKQGIYKLGSFVNAVPFDVNEQKYIRTTYKSKKLKFKYKYRIGVLWYPDVQNFIKKLRITLLRKYNYENYFQVFYSGEYGETTCRPHFHVLLFVPNYKSEDFEFWKRAIAESWSFDDGRRTYENIREAYNAANYIASYINCATYVPAFLRQKPINPKSRHSKFFGLAKSAYQLDYVMQKIKQRDLQYTFRHTNKLGQLEDVTIPFPGYLLRHYFPKIKGYSRLTRDEILSIYSQPQILRRFARQLGYNPAIDEDGVISTINDVDNNIAIIQRAFTRWSSIMQSNNHIDFALAVADCWQIRASNNIKRNYEDVHSIDEFVDAYDNWVEFLLKSSCPSRPIDDPLISRPPAGVITDFDLLITDLQYKPNLIGFNQSLLPKLLSVSLDPNHQRKRVKRAHELADIYNKTSKDRKCKNKILDLDSDNNTVYV